MITLGKFTIGEGCTPFVIAELSGNHNQSLESAMAMIKAAAKAGVQAIKLQTYTADTMTIECGSEDFQILEGDSLWQGQTLHQLYQKAYTPWDWHKQLFDYANTLGIVAFSSPFDESAVDFLETLNVPCYKIASFENNDLPLIKKVAQTKKPVIMSTGMASEQEIEEAVACLRKHGCTELVLLKCTSAYPAKISEANLATITDLSKKFKCLVGVSDHTLGLTVPLTAVALGASVIEKHLVLSREDGGIDADFSLEPEEFSKLVNLTNEVSLAKGKVLYGGSESEQASKKYRRSIYVAQDIKAGQKFTKENIRVIRPGLGLAPKYYEQLIGSRVISDIDKGTPLSAEHVQLALAIDN